MKALSLKFLSIVYCLLSVACCLAQTPHVYTLDETLDLARKNNLQIEKDRVGTESYKELKKSLFTKYFPSVSLTTTYLEFSSGLGQGLVNNILSVLTPLFPETFLNKDTRFAQRGFMGSVSFVEPIYVGGLIHNANKLADLMADVSQGETRIKQNEVEQEVEKYFWTLAECYEANSVIDVVDSLVKVASHDAALALRAGLVTKSDEMQVGVYDAKLKAVRIELDNGKNLCRAYLAHLAGVERYDSIDWQDITRLQAPLTYYVDPQGALEERVETGLLDKQVRAYQLQKKITLGTLLPKFGVGFSLNLHKFWSYNDGGIWDRYIEPSHTGWTFYGAVSVPLSGWWGGYHSLKSADLRIRQAQIDRQDKRGLMSLQIDLKWKEMNNAYEQVQVYKNQMEQACQNEKQQASAYRSGVITMMDRLQSATLYEQAYTNYVQSCAKYRIAVSEYKHVTAR